MKCFYHSADLDGKCSAAIVRLARPKCELIPINYGDPFPWDLISEHETVYMVDFSLQPFSDMLRLREMCDLVWIDHHKSANEENAAAKRQIHNHGSDDTGACAAVWRYFDKMGKIPRVVQLLGEYDVWDHHDLWCLPFQYGMRMEPNDPGAPVWDGLLSGNDEEFDRILHNGVVIYNYQNMQNEGHAKTLCFDANLDGLRLLVANHGPSNSQFFDSAWDPERYDAMCLFYWKPGAGKWTVSLYTDKPDVDVSAVCKARGGGGHKGAAGFQCSELPFALGGTP